MAVLITGAGTLAQALLVQYPGAVLYTRSEYAAWRLQCERPDLNVIVGDIRNYKSFERALVSAKPDCVVHTAAMKQVASGAGNAAECQAVNVMGTGTIVRACKAAGLPMVFTSSDKAVEPTTTYGKAKALAEDIVLQAGYPVTRWGNIVRSRGSVLERWQRTGQVVAVDPNWTRYWLTRDVAAEYLTGIAGCSAGVYVLASKAATMRTVIEASIEAYNIDAPVVWSVPGDSEKPHEKLSVGDETSEHAPKYSVGEFREILCRELVRWPLP